MILYHGTPLESGEKIIQEGKIRCQIKRSHEGYENIIERYSTRPVIRVFDTEFIYCILLWKYSTFGSG